ncbi:MAG: hypothetical protein V3U86_00385 [Acidobacteriota bacterium]
MTLRKRTPRFTSLLTCAFMAWTTLPLTSLAREKDNYGTYSQDYEFVVNEKIVVDQTVGRVHFPSLLVEVKQLRSGKYRLSTQLSARNPKGHDQTVVARVRMVDQDGNVIVSDERHKNVEEGDSKVLKMRTYLGRDPASVITGIVLEIEAWDD